jgi:hypothetical protein
MIFNENKVFEFCTENHASFNHTMKFRNACFLDRSVNKKSSLIFLSFLKFYQLITDPFDLGSIDSNTFQIAELTRISNSTNFDLSKTKLEFSKYEDNQLEENAKLHKQIDDQKQKINELEEKLTTQASAQAKMNDLEEKRATQSSAHEQMKNLEDRLKANFEAKIHKLQDELELSTHKNKRAIEKDRKYLEIDINILPYL